MVWKARVKHHDIGFALREVVDSSTPSSALPAQSTHSMSPSPSSSPNSEMGQAHLVIQPLERYTAEAQIQGRIPPIADRARNVNIFFDNSMSHLQKKTVVYWVTIG
jgi:hypothetical protein